MKKLIEKIRKIARDDNPFSKMDYEVRITEDNAVIIYRVKKEEKQ